MNEDRIAALQQQLLNYFNGDAFKVKRLADDCKTVGFNIRDHIDAIVEHPEQFSLLITYSDLGILNKLAGALKTLKQEK